MDAWPLRPQVVGIFDRNQKFMEGDLQQRAAELLVSGGAAPPCGCGCSLSPGQVRSRGQRAEGAGLLTECSLCRLAAAAAAQRVATNPQAAAQQQLTLPMPAWPEEEAGNALLQRLQQVR